VPKRDVDWSVKVDAASFSPDGKFLLTFYLFNGRPEYRQQFPKVLSLWDVSRCKELWSLNDNDYRPFPFAFLSDGKHILIGGKDALRLLDAANGTVVRSFEHEENPPGCLAVSPDGKLALSSGPFKALTLWDVTSGEPIQTLQTVAFGSVTFSPNGELMAGTSLDAASGGSPDVAIWVWEVAKHDLLLALPRSEDWMGPVAFSPNGKLAVAAWQGPTPGDSFLALWEARTGKVIRKFREEYVLEFAFTPDSKGLLFGNPAKQRIGLWDIATGREVWTTHVGGVTAFAFSANGKQAFTAGGRLRDGWGPIRFTIWDGTNGKEMHSWTEGHGN
jgi:WD40 repeat protein